jgi:hypothetical protein
VKHGSAKQVRIKRAALMRLAVNLMKELTQALTLSHLFLLKKLATPLKQLHAVNHFALVWAACQGL